MQLGIKIARGCLVVVTNLPHEIFTSVLFLSSFLSSFSQIASSSLLVWFYSRFLNCKSSCDSWSDQIPVTLTALEGLNDSYLLRLEKSLGYEGLARPLDGNIRNRDYLTALICNTKVYTSLSFSKSFLCEH